VANSRRRAQLLWVAGRQATRAGFAVVPGFAPARSVCIRVALLAFLRGFVAVCFVDAACRAVRQSELAGFANGTRSLRVPLLIPRIAQFAYSVCTVGETSLYKKVS
jgi:hypothetical protein